MKEFNMNNDLQEIIDNLSWAGREMTDSDALAIVGQTQQLQVRRREMEEQIRNMDRLSLGSVG